MTLSFISCKDEPQTNDPISVDAEHPRYMAYADGNIYITCYYPMAVLRFNVEQQAFTGICKLGQYHPEGIATVGGKLYIASSNISDENYNYHYDNKIYVVDIASFSLTDSVTVDVNPSKVKKLDNSHIVFNTLGDYSTSNGGLWVMNTLNKEVTSLSVNLYNFDVYGGDIYGYTSSYTGSSQFYKIDGNSLEATLLPIQWTASDNPYGIAVNPNNANIVVTSDGRYVSAGDCYIFSNDGTARHDAIHVGMLPSNTAFIDADNMMILNEGAWGSNNAGISRINLADDDVKTNWFADVNGRGLGDVAQDIIISNGKAYVTVSFSNSLEIIDIATGKSTRFATTE
jgi:hypothetical protein